MFKFVILVSLAIAFSYQQDTCASILASFDFPDIGLRDASIISCGNIDALKSATIGGNECAYGKIDHKDSVLLSGDANTNQEFVSGQGSWVLGNVTSAGNIKTKPKEWSASIVGTGTASYTNVSDPTCLQTYVFCEDDDFQMRRNVNSVRVLNKKIKAKVAPNVHVQNGESYDWVPGTYGKVSFGYQSNITVHSGAYNVDHLEIKTEVTFNFADLSNGCDSALVLFNASRTIDIEADFQMSGVQFGNPFTGCTGLYGVFWFSHGDILVKQSQYPLYGAFVADQKIDIERENVVNGCIAGFTGVHIKSRVNLNPYGVIGCTCQSNSSGGKL